MEETRGVIMFNRGEKCLCRAIVALKTLRDNYSGPVTFFLEDPYPHEFDEVCKHYNVDIVYNEENPNVKALVRKTETFAASPYDRTLWIDADVVVLGPIDEMFDLLDDADVAIPHFAGWWSDGKTISRRIHNYDDIAPEVFGEDAAKEIIERATEHNAAVNTGIVAYRKCQFLSDWIALAQRGDGKMFIPDEVAFQVLYPSYDRIKIAPMKYNVSVKHDPGTEDKRIVHLHGQKHCLDYKLCDIWKNVFNEMCEKNEANITHFLKYADKRLKIYLKDKEHPNAPKDVTIVTACDEKYVDILRETFPNWRKYKGIDEFPVIVFVHGITLDDNRLDFLKLPNVKIIEWDMPYVEDHREKMLSAFVFGTAEYVKTDYWLKLDADSYATDYRPLYDESYKEYAFCGHRWGYSRPDHIQKLDEWAKGHWRSKLRKAPPMIEEGRLDGRRFYHNKKRTISFIQLHKSKFTRFCVSLIKEDENGNKRLPAPTQDTFMFYVCDRFDPQFIGVANFKKKHGFNQGNARRGVDAIRAALDAVDEKFKDVQDDVQDDQYDDMDITPESEAYDSTMPTTDFGIKDNSYMKKEVVPREPVAVDLNADNIVIEIVET